MNRSRDSPSSYLPSVCKTAEGMGSEGRKQSPMKTNSDRRITSIFSFRWSQPQSSDSPRPLSQPGAQGIPLVYYPEDSELRRCSIAIFSGKKVEINLALSPQPFYRLSARSTLRAGPAGESQLAIPPAFPLPYNCVLIPPAALSHVNGFQLVRTRCARMLLNSHGHSLTVLFLLL